MTLDEIYEMMKAKLRNYYESDEQMVNLTVVEFMQLYQLVCYMKQIKHVMDWM